LPNKKAGARLGRAADGARGHLSTASGRGGDDKTAAKPAPAAAPAAAAVAPAPAGDDIIEDEGAPAR
jgi:hypothetical protein